MKSITTEIRLQKQSVRINQTKKLAKQCEFQRIIKLSTKYLVNSTKATKQLKKVFVLFEKITRT